LWNNFADYSNITQYIPYLRNVVKLKLGGSKIEADAFMLPNVTSIEFQSGNIREKYIDFTQFPKLNKIIFNNQSFYNQTYSCELYTNLKCLGFNYDTFIDDNTLSNFTNLHSLRLGIYTSRITDKSINKLIHLKCLWCGECVITDNGIKNLNQLKELRCERGGEFSIDVLKQLKNLRILQWTNAPINLEKQLPNITTIIREPIPRE